jgi:SpoVK/Ycf46/Vps4 family AAA+-type ATPase
LSFYSVLKKGHLVETGRTELVAQFIGQTALKTLEVAGEALDGVLFIDEAYTLAPASPNDFGGESIATLIQFMENNRGRIAGIAAGYTQEMNDFISQNPGLRSRFANFIEFHPYTADEMLSIFKGLTSSMELHLSDEVADALLSRFQAVDYTNELGNGRYARELFSQMCGALNARAYRDQTLDLDSLSSFSVADIPEPENKFLNSRSIGFGR